MKVKERKDIKIELSQKSRDFLEGVAKKNILELEDVINLILRCEGRIIGYAASERKKLAESLKIKPTRRFLYHGTLNIPD